MKKTEGYVAVDGTFFESYIDCEVYEAEQELDRVLLGNNTDPDKFKSVYGKCFREALRYAEAIVAQYQAKQKITDSSSGPITKEAQGSSTVPGESLADGDWEGRSDPHGVRSSEQSDTEDEVEAVFEQPPGWREPVSPVGGGLSAEAISYISQELGIGVRGGNASSIRSRPNLATVEDAEPKGPRDGERTEDIRK